MGMEVLTISAHLVISLGVLFSYLYTVIMGKPDTTLQNLLLIIGGYWFGAMGKAMVTRAKDGKDTTGKDDQA